MASSLASLAVVLHVCAGDCLRYPLTDPPCDVSGYLRGKSGSCNTENDSDCCKDGEMYPQYHCSPPVTAATPAIMTIASFAAGGGGGGAAACDGKFHRDDQMLASLSTGWYDGGSRCNKNITINANGRSVVAMVVDECDSVNGCLADQDFQPPCGNNFIAASPAVWTALGIPDAQVGSDDVTWTDA